MTASEAAELLNKHLKWRREGIKYEPFDPKIIDMALEIAVLELSELQNSTVYVIKKSQ
jgi:hypothetical protein